MVHCGDELLTTDEINADVDKIIGYESPITRICENISRQLVEQEKENYMCTINQAVGYAVDKEELIKALQYDRQQYEKGYEDAMSVIEGIKAEIQTLRGCRYSCSDVIIDDVEDIIDKHTSGAKMQGGDAE